jgi:hypothetical protein
VPQLPWLDVSALDDPVLPATARVVDVLGVVDVAVAAVAIVVDVDADWSVVDSVATAAFEVALWAPIATAPLIALNPTMLSAPSPRRARRAGCARRRRRPD